MPAADAIIARQGPVAAPMDYKVPAGAELIPLCITASFNGAAAAGSYVPVVEILTPDGLVLARAVLQQTIPAAEDADVSWFQGVSVCPPATSEDVVGVTAETVFYNTVNAGTPLAMTTVLAAGTQYVIVIEGTYSLWNTALGEGTPEANAQFPGSTAGRSSTQVGLDADTCFARQSGSSRPLGHCELLQLSLDNGVTYSHVEPIGGPYVTPLTGHQYRYAVTGQGHPLHVKLNDINPPDNYGKFRISIQVPAGTGTGSGAGSLVPPADSTLNGDVLTVVTGVPAWAAPAAAGVNTVDSPGATITVTNPSGPTVDLDLPNTGVPAGSYGDATHVGKFTVDAKGRLTAASSQTITGGAIAGISWGGFFQSYYGFDTAAGANTVQANNIKLVRVLIPEDGTLDLVAVQIGVSSGNVSLAVYDTGATTAGTVTRLATTGAVACAAANAYQSFNPGLTVHAGDQLLFAITADNNTMTVVNATISAVQATIVPAGVFATPAAARTLCSFVTGGSHPAPATIVDASLLTGNIHPPCFIGHVS